MPSLGDLGPRRDQIRGLGVKDGLTEVARVLEALLLILLNVSVEDPRCRAAHPQEH